MRVRPPIPGTLRVRRFLAWVTAVLCAAVLVPAVARADNPIVQHIYTADPVNWWQFGGAGGGNLIANGDGESGTAGWGVMGAGTLSSNAAVAHGGAASLSVTGRTASWNGPSQDVTSKLANGRSYTTTLWVRSQGGTPTVKATLALTADGTTSYVSLTPGTAVNPDGWTRLTGTATVSWSGALSGATFYVETASGTDGFSVDDVSLQ